MTPGRVQVAVGFPADRSVSPRFAGDFARQLEATGVVDSFMAWDQLTSWWPSTMWRRDVTPWAEVVSDPDSFPDAFLLSAFAAAATSNLGTVTTTDAIRRGPAELMQTMLTLASATEGRSMLQIGAGELKQTRPFGHKRSEGLHRLEDILRICRLLWETDRPIDFDGNIWKLRNAWLGGVRPHRPQVWALGGGPRLMELAARYADGIATVVPGAFPTPDAWARQVAHVKQQLERFGRDPEQFGFGIWGICLLHEDEDLMSSAMRNPMLLWEAAIGGRLNPGDWQREGITPPFPKDWNYALKLVPADWTADQVDDVLSHVSPEMMNKSFFHGSPESVSVSLAEYVDAGANWITALDAMPVTLPMDEGLAALERTISVCRLLKSRT